MRVLLADILINRNIGESIKGYMNNLYQAETPEVGINLAALLEFYRVVERRDVKYQSTYTNLFLTLGVSFFCLALLFFYLKSIFIGTLLITLIFCGWGIAANRYYMRIYEERYILGELFKKNQYSPYEIVKTFDLRNTRYTNSAEHNLIIYGGGSPFIGVGNNIGGWSFVIDLNRPNENIMASLREPIPFNRNELYEALHTMCKDLKIDGLLDKDYYFVDGKDIREEKPILPHALSFPRQKIPVAILENYSVKSDARVRKFKWIHQHLWNSNIVMSFFFYCDIKGNNLFVEANRFVLLPVDQQYCQIDRLTPWNPRTKLNLIITSILRAPLFAFETMVANSGSVLPENTFDFKIEQRAIEDNPKHNYGSSGSFREMISAKRFDNPFQALDVQMFTKLLERRILNSIMDFLDQHNIDTSDIKERQTTILNSGVMVQGGNITSDSIAVGTGAQAIVSNSPPSKERNKTS